MTMIRSFILTLALCVALPGVLQAQTAITRTTLSVAITAAQGTPTSQSITVASATGISVGSVLWIEGSVYRITAISGTTITVINQWYPASHLSSAGVYVVPLGAQYTTDPTGSCVRGSGAFPLYSPYALHFNVTNGTIAHCRAVALTAPTAGVWVLTRFVVPVASTDPPQTP